MTSLCLLFVLATHYNFHIHQMDVIMDFLNGIHKEVIYIIQSKGFIILGHRNKICYLLKSLYRLK